MLISRCIFFANDMVNDMVYMYLRYKFRLIEILFSHSEWSDNPNPHNLDLCLSLSLIFIA